MPNATVLIVDDNPTNLLVLKTFLEQDRLNILLAESGQQALDILDEQAVDMIMLDIMMPGLDGFQTYEKILENPKIAHIPTIFLTALADTDKKVRAFQMGAVDYVTKPFRSQEVLARVTNHLALRAYERELEAKNQILNQHVREKSELFRILTHNLQDPLAAVLSTLPMLEEGVLDVLPEIRRAIEGHLKLLKNLTRLERLETEGAALERVDIDLANLLESNCRYYLPHAAKKGLELVFDLEADCVTEADTMKIWEVFEHFLSNALKFSPQDSKIKIILKREEEDFYLAVEDQGPGIAVEDQARVFNKFERLTTHPTDNECTIGIGLAIAKTLAEIQDGTVGVFNNKGQGATFYFRYPIQPANH